MLYLAGSRAYATLDEIPPDLRSRAQEVSPLKLAAVAGMSGADVMACRDTNGNWDFTAIIDAANRDR